MSLLASLTRSMSRLSVHVQRAPLQPFLPSLQTVRWKTKRVHRGKPPSENAPDEEPPSKQHKAWVDFQQSIAVEGYETGQTTEITEDRKRLKLNKLEEKILERQRMVGTGGGEFPPMRYSEEETARLLKQAYDSLPKRLGKRGTRHLKRQARRWELVRQIHAKRKAGKIAGHFRRMAKRSRIAKSVRDMKAAAPEMRERDLAYQKRVYIRHMVQLGLKTMPNSSPSPATKQVE